MGIILASASPRRLEIFQKNNINPVVICSNVEEVLPIALTPTESVMYLSLIKALDIYSNNSETKDIIVGADTSVIVNDKILGKPKDQSDAREMITLIQGGKHSVCTGVTVINPTTNTINCFFDETTVFVKNMTQIEIEKYISTDEPYDKAGGYAIQGIFSKYIDLYHGDYDNVVGFPYNKFINNLSNTNFLTTK
ncbi:MAG: Maf family protein [Anaerovoracaceae bacterium]